MNIELTDKHLYTIALKIPASEFFGLGIMLGLTATEIEQIELNNTYIARIIFNVLRNWRDKKACKDQSNIANELSNILKQVNLADAYNYCSQLLFNQ